MKTRQSLVSNSSTSSFVCLIPLKMHNEIIESINDENLTEIAKKFLNGFIEKVHLWDVDLIYYSTMTGNDGINPSWVADEILSKNDINKIRKECEDSKNGYEYIQTLWDWLGQYEDKVDEFKKKHSDHVFVKRDYF